MQVGKKIKIMKMQKGVTYLWMLFFIFILSLGLEKSLFVYSKLDQKQKEKELIYIGKLYQKAIKEYYLSGENSNEYPQKLSDLLKDPRYLVTRRYIRKLYIDPLTNKDFLLIYSSNGGICGVKSRSLKKPIKTFFSENELKSFNNAINYQYWEFKDNCVVKNY